jgi:hypothetical protein
VTAPFAAVIVETVVKLEIGADETTELLGAADETTELAATEADPEEALALEESAEETAEELMAEEIALEAAADEIADALDAADTEELVELTTCLAKSLACAVAARRNSPKREGRIRLEISELNRPSKVSNKKSE